MSERSVIGGICSGFSSGSDRSWHPKFAREEPHSEFIDSDGVRCLDCVVFDGQELQGVGVSQRAMCARVRLPDRFDATVGDQMIREKLGIPSHVVFVVDRTRNALFIACPFAKNARL